MTDTPAATLGQEIFRLRTKAEIGLRQFAERVGVSPAHVSDIEHDRRRPSEGVLRRIAEQLKGVGATYATLDKLNSRLDRDIQKWVASTPRVRQMLREVKKSGRDPMEFIEALERDRKSKGGGKSK